MCWAFQLSIQQLNSVKLTTVTEWFRVHVKGEAKYTDRIKRGKSLQTLERPCRVDDIETLFACNWCHLPFSSLIFFFCRVLKHYTIQYRFDVIIWTTQIYIVSAKYLKIDRIALAEHTAVVTGRHTGIFNMVIQRLTLPQRSSLNLHICLVAHYVLITFKLTVNMQFNFFFLQWYEVRRMFLNIFCLGCVTIHCIYSF